MVQVAGGVMDFSWHTLGGCVCGNDVCEIHKGSRYCSRQI